MQKDLRNSLSELESGGNEFASDCSSPRSCFPSLCRQLRIFVLVSTLAAVASLTLAAPALASVAVWTYAGQNYPTQAAALAAMHAVSANNALLTQQVGISGIGTATVTYRYGAPTLPLTKGPLYICPSDPQGDCNPSSTTADQAVQYSHKGSLPNLAGLHNCQTWADDVLKEAKQQYLAHEHCPKCFR